MAEKKTKKKGRKKRHVEEEDPPVQEKPFPIKAQEPEVKGDMEREHERQMFELLNLIKQTKDYVDSSKLEILSLINQTREYLDLTNKRINLIQEFLMTVNYDKFLKSRGKVQKNLECLL